MLLFLKRQVHEHVQLSRWLGKIWGMNVTYVGSSEIQLGKKESVIDTAKVLGSMFDGIEYRGFKQEDVEAWLSILVCQSGMV